MPWRTWQGTTTTRLTTRTRPVTKKECRKTQKQTTTGNVSNTATSRCTLVHQSFYTCSDFQVLHASQQQINICVTKSYMSCCLPHRFLCLNHIKKFELLLDKIVRRLPWISKKTLARNHLEYLESTTAPWKRAFPKGQDHLPITNFQGQTVSFMAKKLCENSHCNALKSGVSAQVSREANNEISKLWSFCQQGQGATMWTWTFHVTFPPAFHSRWLALRCLQQGQNIYWCDSIEKLSGCRKLNKKAIKLYQNPPNTSVCKWLHGFQVIPDTYLSSLHRTYSILAARQLAIMQGKLWRTKINPSIPMSVDDSNQKHLCFFLGGKRLDKNTFVDL